MYKIPPGGRGSIASSRPTFTEVYIYVNYILIKPGVWEIRHRRNKFDIIDRMTDEQTDGQHSHVSIK